MTSLPGRGALHAQMLCRAYSCQNNRSGQPSVSGRPVISSAWPRRAVRRVPVEFTLGSGDFEESCNELIYVNPRSGVVLRALSTSGPDDGELTMVKDRAEIPSKARLWLAAAKPPMYTVAIAPVFVAAALAKVRKRATGCMTRDALLDRCPAGCFSSVCDHFL